MGTMLREPSFAKACSKANNPSPEWSSQTVGVGLLEFTGSWDAAPMLELQCSQQRGSMLPAHVLAW